MLNDLKNRIFGKLQPEKRIALFVDGPNMLRKEFDLDLGKVKSQVETHGSIKIGTVFLNQFAPDKLIEAVVNHGMQPKIVTSDDVDAPMAVEAMEAIFNQNIDTIALMTRDSDFQSVIMKAKKYGKETIIIGSEQISSALKNTADHIIILQEEKRE